MKKLLFLLMSLICTLSINAQIIRVMKGETVVKEYTPAQADNVVFEKGEAPAPLTPDDGILTFTATGESTIKINLDDTKYKTSTQDWTDYTADAVITLQDGEFVQFKAADGSNRHTLFDDEEWESAKFVMTGTFNASGSVMSLLAEGDMGEHAFDGLFEDCTSLVTAPQLPASTLSDYCYFYMFKGCTNLTSAPTLPAATLAPYCYAGMFFGCTSLTAAPSLNATALALRCYQSMFNGCTDLETAPALPATALAANCYNEMFYNCTSLTAAPALNATTLASECYKAMFNGCTSLTTAPALPATTMAYECYMYMFSGCTSLTAAPALNATALAEGCYRNMFYGCTGLTAAPKLPATSLPERCYFQMFQSCTNLASVEVSFTEWNWTTTSWLEGVAATGTFTCPEGLEEKRGDGNIPTGWTIQHPAPAPETTALTFTALEDMSFISFNLDDTQYKKGDGEWTDYTADDIITLNEGETVQFKAAAGSTRNTLFTDEDHFGMFTMGSGSFDASGSVMSLLGEGQDMGDYAFVGLFANCSGLKTAPELPAETLAVYCYGQMFKECTNLTTAPELPATTLAAGCYAEMFENCTSLQTAPELPAETMTEYCYGYMFYGCASLQTAPTLNATALADECFCSMFHKCTSLTAAPALNVTTLEPDCYRNMFRECTSLQTAPALPATTLKNGCYDKMFYGCTSLQTAPELPATTLAYGCYKLMFKDCSSLNSITVAFTEWGENNNGWLDGVAATGTFTCPTGLAVERGANYIPENWTVLHPAPAPETTALTFTALEDMSTISFSLDDTQYKKGDGEWTDYTANDIITLNEGEKVQFKAATGSTRNTLYTDSENFGMFTMASGSFDASGSVMSLLGEGQDMGDFAFMALFMDCSALKTAPKLPAETLSKQCYSSMFLNCTSLTAVPELPATTLSFGCYSSMFGNCTSLQTAPELPATTLTPYCYNTMFGNCTSLQTAPELPATTLTTYCYTLMFMGCSSLASVEVNFTDWGSEEDKSTYGWLYEVPAAGTFTCPAGLAAERGMSNIPENWTVLHPVEP